MDDSVMLFNDSVYDGEEGGKLHGVSQNSPAPRVFVVPRFLFL